MGCLPSINWCRISQPSTVGKRASGKRHGHATEEPASDGNSTGRAMMAMTTPPMGEQLVAVDPPLVIFGLKPYQTKLKPFPDLDDQSSSTQWKNKIVLDA